MLLVFPGWALVLSLLGSQVILRWLGLSEGGLRLMAGGVQGWVAEVAMSLLLVGPPIIGTVLAVKALRQGAGVLGWVALALNVLPVVQLAASVLDAIHMTYYPQGGWHF